MRELVSKAQKWGIVLGLVVLLGSLIPAASLRAQRFGPPHENPALVRSEVNPIALLQFYNDALSLLSSLSYEDVSQMLDKVKHVDMPGDLRFIVDTFSSLIGELNADFDALEKILAEASALISEVQLEEARQKLEEAEGLVARSETLLGDISNSSAAFLNYPLLNLLGLPEGSPLSQARQTFQQLLAKLEQLQGDFFALYQSLETKTVVLSAGESPGLTLELSRPQVWVGETLTVQGRLYSPDEGGGISGEEIEVLVEGTSFPMMTDADGVYEGEVDIPYSYMPTVTLQAFYRGMENIFLPASSPEAKVRVLFFPTELILEPGIDEAWAGDSLIAQGNLISPVEGKGLSGREIEVVIGEKTFTTATREDGSYQVRVEIPYSDVPGITVQAFYRGMRDVYQPVASLPVDLILHSYQTRLEVTVPQEAYPGTIARLEGKVTSVESGEPLEGRKVQAFLDNILLSAATTDSSGGFIIEATLDPGVAVGEHLLTVVVEPQRFYLGTSEEKKWRVVKLVPQVQVPSLAFVALSREVQVKGKVSSSLGPARGAQVTLKLKGITGTGQTSEDGEFAISLYFSVGLFLAGTQDLKVEVKASEPWLLSQEDEHSILVLDVLTIGLASAALLSLGGVLYARRRVKPKIRVESLQSFPQPRKPVGKGWWQSRELKGEDARGRVLRVYLEVARMVEELTRLAFLPSMTLREFCRESTPALKGKGEDFSLLTDLTEEALYSPRPTGEEEISRAEVLANRMGELWKERL